MPINSARIHPLKRITKALLASALLTLAAAASAKAAVPAVLAQLPDDARAVLVISNIKDLSTKVSNAAVRLNLPAPPDLAGYLTRLAGIAKGFDPNSSAALAILAQPKDKDEEGGPPPMIVLLPTSDPRGMVEGFQPGEPDKAGISEITLPNDRAEKGYVATIGPVAGPRWIALAQDKAVLEAYLARKAGLAKGLTPDALKTFEANDLVVWGNIPALTKGADKFLEDKQQELAGMFDLINLNNNQDPLMSALQKAGINEYFLAMKQYLADASSAMLTLRMSDAGATLGLVGSFKPDSPFAQVLAAQKTAKPISLQGLPTGDFLLAGAISWDSASVSRLMGTVAKRITADEVVAKDPKAKPLATLLEQYQAALQLVTGAEYIMLEPAPGGGAKNGLFSGAYLLETTDPQKLQNLWNEMIKSPLVRESLIADIKQDMKVTPDAVTIKSTKLTKIHTTFTLREEPAGGDKPVSEIAKKQIEMMHKMYGADGVTIYHAAVGKRVLVIFGSDPAILEAAVAAAETNANDLANNPVVTAAKDQLVPNALAVNYLSMGRVLALVQSAMMPGAPAAPAQGAAAPVVMSAGVNAATLTMELHVPTTTIATVKEMVQRMMMGRGPGGGENMQP